MFKRLAILLFYTILIPIIIVLGVIGIFLFPLTLLIGWIVWEKDIDDIEDLYEDIFRPIINLPSKIFKH